MRSLIFFSIFLLNSFFSLQASVAVTAPKGWQCIRDAEQLPLKVKCLYVGTAKGQFSPSINIAQEEATLDIESYTKQALTYHNMQRDTICKRLGKMQTKMGSAELLQIERPTQWGHVRFIQGILMVGNDAIVITGTCLQEDFSQLSPAFFKSIQSIHFE